MKNMAKHVCKAANRALGLVIAKCKVFGDFNFESYSKLYDTLLNQWQHLKSMDNNRINYKIFEWCEQNVGQRCKTWNFRINMMLRDAGRVMINDVSNYRVIKDQVSELLFSRFKREWSADIN